MRFVKASAFLILMVMGALMNPAPVNNLVATLQAVPTETWGQLLMAVGFAGLFAMAVAPRRHHDPNRYELD